MRASHAPKSLQISFFFIQFVEMMVVRRGCGEAPLLGSEGFDRIAILVGYLSVLFVPFICATDIQNETEILHRGDRRAASLNDVEGCV